MTFLLSCISIFACVLFAESRYYNLPPSCDSPIYCQGKLLHDIQLSGINKDSKTFVDMRLHFPPETVLKKYDVLSNKYENKIPPAKVLNEFMHENFDIVNELVNWTPPDWRQNPAILNKIRDEGLKDWAFKLNYLWKNFSRRMTDDVAHNPQMYSIIHIPNGFIIPGGRFKEIYYWDSHWIVNGLLVCDMHETVKGIIGNLLHLLRSLGHIPNGSRVYYKERSQPPLVTFMMKSYLKYTKDFDFVKNNIWLLDKEMDYWINNQEVDVSKNGKVYKMYRYYAPSKGPRPESYREDVETTKYAKNEDERNNMFVSLKTAAESGWDFSSRWFIKDGTNKGNISNIIADSIVPVDLNAIMCRNFITLLEWYKIIGNVQKVNKYRILSTNLFKAIKNVLWNKEENIWLDFDLKNGMPRKYFYMSNFSPFWTKCHDFTPQQATKIALNYIDKNKLRSFPGGVPTSLEHSGEQWDYPNSWSPLQGYFIEGLKNIGTTEAYNMAYLFAIKYVRSTYKGFVDQGFMYEKYNSLFLGRTGGGGEYEPQMGFGWSNGVAFELLNEWGDKLTPN